ncbi:TauD/TfdA family dioxygenase [Trinickia mobilis]|uniref:TauD/TfdA family dioxygenase n=1 Tax=Trinickia mobilis TaxID=2816356 RepID=UPI001A8E3DB2|nr:TauD/TfdA family dioxygenase [Trinickia mobilis]
MKPIYVFSDVESRIVKRMFEAIDVSPYADYHRFSDELRSKVSAHGMPAFLKNLSEQIAESRKDGCSIHVLENCPVDEDLPYLGHVNPAADKKREKKSFVAESFMELISLILGNPLISYSDRNDGDFFTDVISLDRFRGGRSGFSDGDLVYHNDRASHPVRADYIALLGMRCVPDDLTYTTYVDGRDILERLSESSRAALKVSCFVTDIDDRTREKNPDRKHSEPHAILSDDCAIRFIDTLTRPNVDAPRTALEALLEFKDAISNAKKYRHRIKNGDLLIFSNQYGLHNRERIEIPEDGAHDDRWLLKTYNFSSHQVAQKHASHWVGSKFGCVSN